MKLGRKLIRRDYQIIKLELEQRRLKRLETMRNRDAFQRANQQRIRQEREQNLDVILTCLPANPLY